MILIPELGHANACINHSFVDEQFCPAYRAAIGVRVVKYRVASSCLSMRVAAQATEALAPHHVTRLVTNYLLLRHELVAETLMIALVMRMGQVLLNRRIQRAFSQYHHGPMGGNV